MSWQRPRFSSLPDVAAASRRAVLVVAVLVLAAPALARMHLYGRAPGEPLPPSVQAAIAKFPRQEPQAWGYQRLAELVLRNRRDLEAGRISAAEAQARGGILITGLKRFPVLPYLYTNSGSAPYTTAVLTQQLFTGPWPTGTMTDYYKEISYHNFSVDGDVYDWFTLAHDDGYYEGTSNGLDPANARTDEIITECIAGQDAAIDFSQYDNDGPDGIPNSGDDDGYVDFIMFNTPDIGGECSATGGDNIWSHASFLTNWGVSAYTTDDPRSGGGFIRINKYLISAGLRCDGSQAGIGTVCHEFGHSLGIVDLYDTDNSNGASEGLGHWCLMGAGNWNSQDHPAHMCAWCKERLGWLSYFRVTQNIDNLCLPPVESDPVAVRLWTNGANTNEYFVIENRQPIGFDDQLHGNGLVIYHVDEDVYDANASTNSVNADETHKAIDVECADATSAGHVANADDLDSGLNRGDSGDVWCTDTKTTFDGTSVPDTRAYSGAATQCAVQDIGACDGTPGQPEGWICATYLIGTPAVASLCMHDCASDGCAEITNCDMWWGSPDIWIDNDDDGADDYPADGVDNHLWFRVENTGPGTLANVQVRLYYGDPGMGQLWPSTGTLIDSKSIPVMNPTDVVEDYVVFTYPDPPAYIDHYCIGAVAVHASDPQNSEYPPNDNNVAQVNHQVLVARAGGKALDACPGPFVKRSGFLLHAAGDPEGLYCRLVLGTPPDYNDVQIPANWTFTYPQDQFFVPAGQPLQVFVTMESDNADGDQSAHVPLTLYDVRHEVAAGGVVLDYLIDCYDPKAPQNEMGECLQPRPDDLGGPNVKISWSKVAYDQNGELETVKDYEVYRADNQGHPETLISTVAIDAEPDEPGFQFYDTVVWDDGYVYTYRSRAVDASGSPGLFSQPIVVDCASLTGSDDQLPPRSQLQQNRPNPFNPSTMIAYSLEQSGAVRLVIFDAAGRLVRTLVHGSQAAGPHEVRWDGLDDAGRPVPSGVYVYRLHSAGVEQTRKLMLAR